MKEIYPLLALSFVVGVSLRGGPKEDAVVALMRLADQPNYTWATTISDDARTYEIDGKTCSSGYSLVKMPVINLVRRRLGRDISDTRIELVFHGSADCVLLTDVGWLRPDELPPPEDISDFERLGRTGPGSLVVTRANAAGMKKSPTVRGSGSVGLGGGRELPAYSNLQLAIGPPHEELGVIVSSHTEFNVEGDAVTGELTNVGAQLLLVRDGQPHINPLGARGTFRIWLRGGLVVRYQLELEGTLAITTPRSARITVNVHQRSTTVVSDVGATKIELPDIAKAKLAAR